MPSRGTIGLVLLVIGFLAMLSTLWLLWSLLPGLGGGGPGALSAGAAVRWGIVTVSGLAALVIGAWLVLSDSRGS